MSKSEKRRLSPFLFQKQTRIVRRIGYNMLVYGVVCTALAMVCRVLPSGAVTRVGLAVFTVPAVFGGPIVCVIDGVFEVAGWIRWDIRCARRRKDAAKAREEEARLCALTEGEPPLWETRWPDTTDKRRHPYIVTTYYLTADGRIIQKKRYSMTDTDALRGFQDIVCFEELSFERFHEIVCASKDEGAAALVTLTPETRDRFYKSLSRGEYSPDPTGIL